MHPISIPKVIGHRGACRYAPENTLASLRKAAELGATWVEFDAMLTQDAVLIVMHDETLDRTTNGHGLLSQTPYAQIAKLDAGSWFSPEFKEEKVPTVLAFLTEAERLGLGVNLEIKPTYGKDIETAFAVVQLLQTHGFDQRMNLLVTSFSPESLAIVRALQSNIRMGFLLEQWIIAWHEVMDQLNCVSLHTNYKILTPQTVDEVKQMGKLLLAYTVNDPVKAKELYAMGVDGVFSDNLLGAGENSTMLA